MKSKLAEGAKDAEQAKAQRTGNVASTEHHKANPGPVSCDTHHQTHAAADLPQVMAENLPEPASKEELKKRAEELNK